VSATNISISLMSNVFKGDALKFHVQHQESAGPINIGHITPVTSMHFIMDGCYVDDGAFSLVQDADGAVRIVMRGVRLINPANHDPGDEDGSR
jgi:hypothetical protein